MSYKIDTNKSLFPERTLERPAARDELKGELETFIRDFVTYRKEAVRIGLPDPLETDRVIWDAALNAQFSIDTISTEKLSEAILGLMRVVVSVSERIREARQVSDAGLSARPQVLRSSTVPRVAAASAIGAAATLLAKAAL